MMKYLQKFGNSRRLPAAVLLIAGILSGIGSGLCLYTMQGGGAAGFAQAAGSFLVQASRSLFGGAMIALLAAVMADDHDGISGLAGFSFLAAAADPVSASPSAGSRTYLLIPLGIAAAVVCCLVFRVASKRSHRKIPGRGQNTFDGAKAVRADNDFTAIAKILMEGLGGKRNIISVDNCITRLRLEIRDYTQVDEKKIRSAGVAGVIRPSKTSVQIIIGTQVQQVADEFKKRM